MLRFYWGVCWGYLFMETHLCGLLEIAKAASGTHGISRDYKEIAQRLEPKGPM